MEHSEQVVFNPEKVINEMIWGINRIVFTRQHIENLSWMMLPAIGMMNHGEWLLIKLYVVSG